MSSQPSPSKTSPALAPILVASNPTTPAEKLQDLGTHHSGSTIRRLIASNPNTPPETLLQLAKDFPKEVVDNPVFLLLELEDPDFVRKMERADLIELLKIPNLPPVFIRGAILHPDYRILKSLLQRSELSENDLERLRDRVYEHDVGWLFLQHPSCTDRLRFTIAEKGPHFLQLVFALECLANLTEVSIDWLTVLIEHSMFEVQNLIALNNNIPDTLLDQLFQPRHYAVQGYIAYCYDQCLNQSRYSDDILLRLAQNQVANITERIEIRQSVAAHTVNLSILTLLSRDPYARVRSTVALRATFAEELLLHLSEDPSDVVQRNLVKNLNIDSTMLNMLSQRSNLRSRELVAQHPNTPIDLLQTLAQDPPLQQHISRHPNTPIEILKNHASQGTQDIALSQNPKIPDAIVHPILAKLAIDPRYTVRKLVARHPQASLELLKQLAIDRNEKVQQLAQKRLTKL